MKIVYFYQYFSTPQGAWGTRVYEFAKEWVSQGHDVAVVTAVYSKSDLITKNIFDRRLIDGIDVRVIGINIDNTQTYYKRILSFFGYAIFSSWYALTLKADIVIASSGPITAWIPGLLSKFFRRRKLVLEVRDLWPEGAVALGVIKNPILIKAARAFEIFCYRFSDGIVALSPGMKKNIANRVNEKPIISITNSANIEMFSTARDFYHSSLLPKKYAIYTGNIGEVNNSRWLLDAAKILTKKGRADIKILVVGEGKQRVELVLEARNLKICNFLHMQLMPKTDLIPFVQHALVSLVPLRGLSILDTSSPNKFFESLAAGVPVIQNTHGWMMEFLDHNQVGFTIDHDDPEGLADLLISLDSSPEIRKCMGERAKQVAASQFDQIVLANKMLNFLNNTILSG